MIWREIEARPLLIAGPSAVAGVLLAGGATAFTAAAGVFLLALAAWRWRRLSLFLGAVAGAAGLVAGLGHEAQIARDLRALRSLRARAPPRVVSFDIRVEKTGADPFRKRAWSLGRTASGLGVLCVWSGRNPRDVAPGARVRVTGVPFFPRGPTNPGGRDRVRALARSGASLVLDPRTPDNIEVVKSAPTGPAAWLERLRRNGVDRMHDRLPGDVAPLATALLFGARSGIASDDRILFERTGTMHLLAISGMHVLLLAGSIHKALRWLGAGPRLAAGCTLALAIAYVPLTGGAPPIRRAVTGLAFYGVALMRGRPGDPASALGGAALVSALFEPAQVDTIGFRLSFCAAAAISLLAARWSRAWGARHRLLARFPAVRADRPVRLRITGYFWRAFPVALAAWLGTATLVADAFGRLTPLAPLVNIAVAPVLVLLLPMLAAFAAGVDALAGPCTLLMRCLRLMLQVAEELPASHFAVVAPGAVSIALWTSGWLLLSVHARKGVALLACAALIWIPFSAPESPALLLFDVGHGQAALLRTPDGATILVDAGSRSHPALARHVLLPALRSLGVRTLDLLVCTHADADHWNAIPELLAELRVRRLVVGRETPPALRAAARRHGVAILRVAAGDALHASSRSRLTVLAATGATDNDASLVLLFEIDGRRILLPADREEAGLDALLEQDLPPTDVLIAPHHGARCHAAGRLGRRVRPRWLLVSTARGFADDDTLRAYGAPSVFQTCEHGCLVVEVTHSGDVRVRPWNCYDPSNR
ncbi:MAG: ComEC/Rec2 family competence protein [Planctomycetota bacterium]|nr:ComEC/Rec2 family competence protein [Planctomycetota bacterium]